MRRVVATAIVCAVAWLALPTGTESQTWPDVGVKDSGLEWIIGSYAPISALGSFDSYRIRMDPWLTAGVSLRSGALEDRFRPRFEITAVPGVAMRRDPVRGRGAECEGCTTDSLRLTLLGARFLMDVTFPFLSGTRAYVTAGPTMRVQLSDVHECPRASGRECALPQFARERVDPGLLAGVGWEPGASYVRGVQLTGRVSFYGRGSRPEALPASWLPEIDLTVRFNLSR